MARDKLSATAERHLPLKPTDYLTLVALSDGERHGYGLVKQIETLSGGNAAARSRQLLQYFATAHERRAVGRRGSPPRPTISTIGAAATTPSHRWVAP